MGTCKFRPRKHDLVMLAVLVILSIGGTAALASAPAAPLFQSSPPQVSPTADFYWYPSDPSTYDSVQFCDNSYDPAYYGFNAFWWDFGDGFSATGYCAYHQYAKDGTYTVWHKVQTTDGRTGEISKTVIVSTHDVAISKFTVPSSASAGQTKSLVVGVRNNLRDEVVQVDLYKSDPTAGYSWVGSSKQLVPVRSSNRTTDFTFNYTFTGADATVGKVTFKAVATIQNARDAIPGNNTVVSGPIKVSGKK